MENLHEIQEGDSTNYDSEEGRKRILCLLFKNGKLGAAFFDFEEKILYMYEEISDSGPNFMVATTLYREVAPKYLLLFNCSTDEFTKAILESRNTLENDTTYSSNSGRMPPNVFFAPPKDFSYEVCRTIVNKIKVCSMINEDASKPEHELQIHSLINLSHRQSVQTLGALYQYLEKNWQFLKVGHDEEMFCFNISQITMKNHVLLSNETFKALQIFSRRSHEAGFKRGTLSSSREGLSVFKLFLSDCKSKLGQTCLRNMLMSPINDKEELEKRLDFISLVMHSDSTEYVQSVQTSIARLADINLILVKIKNAKATNRNWNSLLNTIKHIISITQISKPFMEKSKLLRELNEATTENLIGLQQSIENTLDFQTGNRRGRSVIKFGLDEMLDAKLLRRNDINKHITAAASFAVNDLPHYINTCKVVYLPEMGHVMEIQKWEPDCDPEALNYLGFQFMFCLGDSIFYKNPLCVELDKQLGDINSEIIDHENRILRRLSAFTLKYSQDIRTPLNIIAMIDSLIAMSKTARRNGYVRPTLNNENVHEIINCRHPLIEQLLNNFQANDFKSGANYSHVKIFTGPNGSGKSAYLKQVALNIYLAHVGSFVPARKANIGLTNSIHCRMHATESACVKLSSFMIDIAQTSQALHHSSSNSVIIIDEFGRGTLDDDGLLLLASVLKTFLQKAKYCPHVLVSTHFQRIVNYIPESNLVEYLKMDYIKKEQKETCFLYTISKGMSNSYALDMASTILRPDLVGRAKEFLKLLQDQDSSDSSSSRQTQ